MINKFIFCQDGENPSKNSCSNHNLSGPKLVKMFNLGYGNKYNNSLNNGNINFVGIIIYNNNALISVPKHYTNDVTKMNIYDNKSDLIIILKAMIKAQINNDKDYSGISPQYYIGYPFTNVWFIYKYYCKFGIYSKLNIKLRKGYYGKILWNNTIKQSNMYLTDNGPVFLPFIINDKLSKFNLISYCMDTILQYTLKWFQHFLPLLSWKYTPQFKYRPQLLKNRKFTILRLEKLFHKTFNERTEFLIENIVMFLKHLGRNKFHFNLRVTGPYNQVWEDAVNVYLETKLDLKHSFQNKLHKPHFYSKSDSSKHFHKFNHPGKLVIGKLYNCKKYGMKPKGMKNNQTLKLEPDHYEYRDLKTCKFIFDSKYYKTLNELNMKQIVYQLYFQRILKKKVIINSLVLPTEHSRKVLRYFQSDPKRWNFAFPHFIIWATYLNTKHVLNNYIHSSINE